MTQSKVAPRFGILTVWLVLIMAMVPSLQGQDWGWPQQDKLTATDGAADDIFGSAVSISGDFAIVGAYADDNPLDSGSAYIFQKADSPDDPNWYIQCKLSASDLASKDRFAITVSISGDYCIIGAPYDDDAGDESGSAYIFKRSSSPTDPNWYQQCKIIPQDIASDDYFGWAVSIDGDFAIVGSHHDDDNGASSGSAYIFEKSDTPSDPNWYQQAKLIASDGQSDDYFGASVALSGDYAIIGAYGDDDLKNGSGSAYIFQKAASPADPNWYQQTKLTPIDPDFNSSYGFAVSISGDRAIVGKPGDFFTSNITGSAYIYQKAPSPADPNWYLQNKVTADDAAIDDHFGAAVSISADYAIIGAESDDDGGISTGSAYIFKEAASDWQQQYKITSKDPANTDSFGYSVALDGEYAVVGAVLDDEKARDAGAAYIDKLTCPPADLDGDCRVGLTDMAIVSGYWLQGI